MKLSVCKQCPDFDNGICTKNKMLAIKVKGCSFAAKKTPFGRSTAREKRQLEITARMRRLKEEKENTQ